eukprot:364284-Chlamydomonas_euryale.AAC.12
MFGHAPGWSFPSTLRLRHSGHPLHAHANDVSVVAQSQEIFCCVLALPVIMLHPTFYSSNPPAHSNDTSPPHIPPTRSNRALHPTLHNSSPPARSSDTSPTHTPSIVSSCALAHSVRHSTPHA